MSPPPRSPVYQILSCVALLLLGPVLAPLQGAEAADPQIKAAVADIEKYERQFAGQAAVNAATVARTLRLLSPTRERLDSSPNKSHASWIDADARLQALLGRLQSLANPPAPAAGVSPATPAAAQARPPVSSTTPQMISQDRVRLQKLIRDIASATDTLDRNGVKPFQDAGYTSAQTALAGRFRESLTIYSEFPADADVVAATAAVTKFENMIGFGRTEAAKQTASLGDVQAQLRELETKLQRMPPPPTPPYAGDVVGAWLVALAGAREAAAAHVAQLEIIRQHAHLPNQPGTVGQGAAYDMQDVDRLNAGFRNNVREIDESLAQFSADLDLQVTHLASMLEFVHGLDPADPDDQANAFLGAGKSAEIRQRLAGAQRLMAVAVDFDRQLGREQLASHITMQTTVESSVAAYDTKLAQARERVRLPKAASTDKALLAIAHETLRNPKYEVGPIRRLVINADKEHREKTTSETEFNKVGVSAGGTLTLSGTETTYTYAWDQFQVATVEPVRGTFFIYYNTLKHFTSGGPTTPLNRWILAERIEGCEIPEANIDRN